MAEAIPFKSSGTLPLSRLTELTTRPIGKLPWTLVPNHLHAAVLDADENTLFISSIGVAEQVLAAVNAHLGLISKSAELELGLRCLHGSLHEIDRKTPNVRKMITMAQHALGMANGCDND